MGAFVMAEVIGHLRGAKKRQYSAHDSQQLVNNHPQIPDVTKALEQNAERRDCIKAASCPRGN